MIRNFFKVAYRNLVRNKGFSFINIMGLAIGMVATILILLWIQDELGYEGFHEHKDRIYEVWNRVPMEGKVHSWNTVPALTARTLEKDVPEIERAVRVNYENSLLTVGDKKTIREGCTVDTGFLQMFSFPMVAGNPATALNDVHGVVLTEKTAKILFGNETALGKIVRIENDGDFTVTGVVKDAPENTRFKFDYLLTWAHLKQTRTDFGWSDNSTATYVLLKPNITLATVNAKIKDLKQGYDGEAKKMKWEWFLYPLSRWRLHSSFTNGVEDNGGRIVFVKLFGIIAAFIVLIACINFMNLSTARSEKRAKEVGVRKVVGAQRGSLIGQFIGESVFLVFLAALVAVTIAFFCLPAFNRLTGKQLFIDFGSVYTWAALVVFILFTGLLAGGYPAFFLSSFRPVKVLKGTYKNVHALVTPRKVLVVLQFTFAIVLIICTIIVKQQIDYASGREAGYDRDNVVYHYLTGDLPKNYELVRNELLSSGIAKSVTKTNSPLTERWSNGWGQNWEGKAPDHKTAFDRYMADEGLGATAGLQFVQGRDFDLKKFPTDSTGLIINESALKVMGFKDPIGKTVSDLGTDWHIVGVIRDFILTSPYEPTRPMLICGAKSSFLQFNVMHVKLNGSNGTAANLAKMTAIFQRYNPEYPFEAQFVDAAYARKFEDETLQGKLAGLFAALAIFISCLGLFGLATYMAESRVKEIGIRKILGASVTGITVLLSRDFVKLVGIAFLIALPPAWLGMHHWLQHYSYRVDIAWWVFFLAGGLSVTIALLTVSYQSIRAATANPVKSLKAE